MHRACTFSMASLSSGQPLLSDGDFAKNESPKKMRALACFLKCVMWAIFISWVVIIFIFPSELGQLLFQDWVDAADKTIFGLSGTALLLLSGPVMAIAFLAVAYLSLFPRECNKWEKPKQASFSLWTFPVVVDGPFGVVSAAELVGILLFVAYVVWAVYAYAVQSYQEISDISASLLRKSCLMLENMGLHFGTIGLFCLAFLFLPVARGSILLRFIDIPFERAVKYHVWLGHLMMAIFTLHGVCYLVTWKLEGRLIVEMLQWKSLSIANLPGEISLLAGWLMWLTSLHPVRKHYFELFFFTHQLYVIFLVFFVLHVGDFIFSMVLGPILLFALDRFLRFFQSRTTVDVVSAHCFPCDTVELIFSKPTNLKYNALSFIFLQVREISWLQWHPFSVSSSPLESNHQLSVLVKVLGVWTKKLKDNVDAKGEHEQDLPFQSHPSISTSIEGPFGHECAYHLMYGNLILVAGGIGISPFLAILSDILHRIRQRKPCLPKSILIIWAVKKSKELSLISTVNPKSICPSYMDKLYLELQSYVTQETQPPLEDNIQYKRTKNFSFSSTNGSSISTLAGTGNILWFGAYIVSSTIGFVIILGLMEVTYRWPFNVSAWWYLGLLFLICMIASVVIFGGAVILLWHRWENQSAIADECVENFTNGKHSSNEEADMQASDCSETNFVEFNRVKYGCRPNIQAIFHSFSEGRGPVDVGVIVCGPSSLETSVAKECRSLTSKRKWNQPIFHFHSHSFEF